MSFISLTPKNIYFQLAMISFFTTYFLENDKIHFYSGLILAYTFLFIWEYSITKTITIDVIIWNLLFIGVNIYKIIKIMKLNKSTISSK